MLSVSLANVLILNDDSLTPWTNVTLVRVPDYPYLYYKDNRLNGYAISANASITQFADLINNMTFDFEFDWAVGIMKYKIFNF